MGFGLGLGLGLGARNSRVESGAWAGVIAVFDEWDVFTLNPNFACVRNVM